MKNGRLLTFDTAEEIKKAANADSFERAFVQIAREVEK